MLETLVLGGTSQSEKPETKVTMVAIGNNQHDRNLPSNDTDNQRRGGRQQKQDNRNSNSRDNSSRSQVAECGLCNIIQGKEVSQDYMSMDFNQRHQIMGNRPIYPNMCLPWMMLSLDEREKVL